jgi:hypothetical protein
LEFLLNKMAKIQEKLNKLRPYVVGIRYIGGVQLVDAVLKEGWITPESKLIRKQRVDGEDNYYMFIAEDESVDVDDLLDYVQSVIELNIEREKKFELLTVKVTELKALFKVTPLNKLEKLKFTFSEPDVIPTSLLEMDDSDIDETKLVVEQKTFYEQNNKRQHKNIALPPKGKVELEEFKEPKVVCKCGPDDICPVCEEEKAMEY